MSTPASSACFGCLHLRITHDPRWPYACLHFAIRSRRLPAHEVEAASGEPCAARQPRELAGEDLPGSPTGRA